MLGYVFLIKFMHYSNCELYVKCNLICTKLVEHAETGSNDYSKALEMSHMWAKKDPSARLSAQDQLSALKWLVEDMEWKLAAGQFGGAAASSGAQQAPPVPAEDGSM